MQLADFNPSILFLLLWGLLSWFTNKKKRDSQTSQTAEQEPSMEKKKDLFERLRKLQDHLAGEVDIFPTEPEEIIVEDKEYFELDLDEPLSNNEPEEEIHEVDKSFGDISIPVSKDTTIEKISSLTHTLSDRNELKKAIILKEILDIPRALRPY